MSMPTYEDLMLPFLKFISDGQEYSFRDIVEFLAKEFNISDEERKQLLPSGQQSLFDNRAGWAKTHLKKSGLLCYPKRGFSKITDKGLEVLSQNPERIDNKYLMQFPEFAEFFKPSYSEKDKIQEECCLINEEKTPDEILNGIIETFDQQLIEDLLERIKQNKPIFFENLVASLLIKMNYGSSVNDILQNAGKSGDEGIDGIIKEDVLGLDKIYVQAKRWQNPVGRPEIQKFAGALQMQNAHKGIFITTSTFTKDAAECISRFNSNIVLINGEKLAELMIKYNLGVQIKQIYEVKKIDEDFFLDEI